MSGKELAALTWEPGSNRWGHKMHGMQDHLCRVKRRTNQGTPHGVEGNPHTGPKPLVGL